MKSVSFCLFLLQAIILFFIMWVPGHSVIKGQQPTFIQPTNVKTDSIRIIDIHMTGRNLKDVPLLKVFTKLCMRCTGICHEHLMSKNPQQQCSACLCPLTVEHLLDDCSAQTAKRHNLFRNNKPSD